LWIEILKAYENQGL